MVRHCDEATVKPESGIYLIDRSARVCGCFAPDRSLATLLSGLYVGVKVKSSAYLRFFDLAFDLPLIYSPFGRPYAGASLFGYFFGAWKKCLAVRANPVDSRGVSNGYVRCVSNCDTGYISGIRV